MERSGKFTLAVQNGKFAYFAEVVIAITVESGVPGLDIELPGAVDASWAAGARFGVAYAFEKAPLHGIRDSAVSVTIELIRGHVVDTTSVLVAYASARAFWDALQVTPSRHIVLDDATGTVSFPK